MAASAWALSDNTSDNNPMTFGASGVEAMRIVSTSKVGIGRITPTVSLEVSGTISATNLVVNGVSITGGGAAALSGLTDVSVSSPMSGGILTYANGKWQAVSPSQILSTTTMVPSWPDAITCNATVTNAGGSGFVTFYPTYMPFNDGKYYYYTFSGNAWGGFSFNADGTFGANNGVTSNDCSTQTIAQLYSNGRAFNFIGTSGSSSSALGDRITSGTLVAVANSATGYISLTTNSTNWGYLSSGASYLPNLTAGLISATNISGTLIQVGTGNGVSCDASHKGSLRYSTTSSTMEYCNSSAWTSMGPSSTSPVAFSVNKGGTNQTITTNSWTKLTWSTEEFDTNGNFSSDRFTPTIAGKYLVTLSGYCTDSTSLCNVSIYKNGSSVIQGQIAGSLGIPKATVIVDMNGSTDYLEGYIFNGGGTTISGAGTLTKFSGVMIASTGGSGGGGTSPGGNSTDIQYNSGGAFTGTDNFAWVNGTNTVSVTGTVSATYGYFKYISATSGLGGGSMATLTDVSASSPSSGMLLRYNGSKWESVGASIALSSTTMVQSWPDAIACTHGSNSNYTNVLYGPSMYTFGPPKIYRYYSGAGDWLAFNADTGAATSDVGTPVAGCSGKSITTLYASGQAFNLVGGQYGGSANQIIFHNGAQGIGDNNLQWVSGTATVSVTGTVSATNGYFKNISTTNLVVAGLTVTGGGSTGDRISTTNVSSGATLGMVVADQGTISFTLGGTAGAAYLHPTLGFVGAGVSTTGPISGSTIYASGNMFAAAYLHNSDRRLKDNITPVSNPFGILQSITGVHFNWKSNGKPSFGVIAQDVRKVMPEAVEGGENKMMSVDYDQLLSPMIQAIKELKADNDNLRRDFEAYKRAHP